MPSKPKSRLLRSIQEGSLSKAKRALKDNPSLLFVTDDEGRSPLHIAAESDEKLPLVKYLLSKKADPNATDGIGWTPLHSSASSCQLAISEELLRAKNAKILPNEDGASPLFFLVRLPEESILDVNQYKRVLKAIIKLGGDVNETNAGKETPLQQACYKGSLSCVYFLLTNGADANMINGKKETPLHWALRRNLLPFVSALIKFGADPFLTGCVKTPIEMAIEAKQKDFVALMKERAVLCGQAKVDCNKCGYLSQCTAKKSWRSVFCVLKETTMFLYDRDGETAKPIGSFNIMDVVVKECTSDKDKKGALYAFTISEEVENGLVGLISTLFRTETEIECSVWIDSITQGKRICQRSDMTSDASQIGTNEEITKTLAILMQDENSFCVDCSSQGAYWMLQKYGALVCYDCAQIHKALAPFVTIKAIHFDHWSLDDTILLQCNGNANHNDLFDSSLTLHLVHLSGASISQEKKKKYINDKYYSEKVKKKEGEDSGEKKSPRMMDLKKVLRHRIRDYHIHYPISKLLDALSINNALWQHMQGSSSLKKIKSLLGKNEDKDESLTLFLVEKLPVAKPLINILPLAFQLVRKLNPKSNQCTSEAKEVLKSLLNLYIKQQESIYDCHVASVMKWWLPQITELLAMEQCSIQYKFDLSGMYSRFKEAAVLALFLFSGEYLLVNFTFPPTLADDITLKKLKENKEKIKKQCNTESQSLRKLETSICVHPSMDDDLNQVSLGSITRSRTTYSNGDPSTSNFSLAREESVFSWDKSGESLLSHSLGMGDVNVENETNPLFSLLAGATNSLSAMVCSVVYEYPSKIRDLIGIRCSGHTIKPTTSLEWVNLFSPFVSHISATSILHTLERLRKNWPVELTSETAFTMQRQVYLLRTEVDALFSLSILWDFPEVWSHWEILQGLLHQGLTFLFQCALTMQPRSFVCNALCTLIVQLRWTIKKLCEIENKPISAIG